MLVVLGGVESVAPGQPGDVVFTERALQQVDGIPAADRPAGGTQRRRRAVDVPRPPSVTCRHATTHRVRLLHTFTAAVRTARLCDEHEHRHLARCATDQHTRFIAVSVLKRCRVILSVFFALIVHSELKSVHPGFPVAFIF